jgi:DNA-directed RNA polymerase sigma subunit (sigma70/sigma32)
MNHTVDDDKQGTEAPRVHTYEEIAQELGITRSAARKIEQRALRKLRKALEDKGQTLSDYI